MSRFGIRQIGPGAQQRIRGDDRAEVEQNLPWNAESLARETLPIGKTQRASLESFAQHAILGFQVLDDDQLLTADPPGEQEHYESGWRWFESDLQSLAWRARLCSGRFPSLVG